MPYFKQDHEYLLEYSHIFEPKKQYSFDYTFALIDDEISKYEQWKEFPDGPIPGTAQIFCTHGNWYTQYWSNCASRQLAADLTDTNSKKSAIIPSRMMKPSTQDTSSTSMKQ